MRCIFGHKWEVIKQSFGKAEMVYLCGLSRGSESVKAELCKCSRCGKKQGFVVDGSGHRWKRDYDLLEYQMNM
jgi:uncharacterized protein YcgL (UPF0745 family)